MYIISELTGRIYLNGVEIPLDDSTQEFQQYLEDKDIVGVEYVEATEIELEELNKPKVPEEISAMRLKLQLFDMGITDQDIFDDIDSIPDFMFSFAEKEKAKIKYKTAVTFQRTNAELNFIATMEGLTQEQVDKIFINGNQL